MKICGGIYIVFALICFIGGVKGNVSSDSKCYTSVDLVLALDASGSVGLNNWKKEVEFAKQLISNFDISETGTHIGVTDFSQEAKPRVDLNSNAGKQVGKINETLESLKEDYQNGMTYTDLALKEAFKMFQNVPASRTVPKLFIVVTDGFTTWREGKTGMQLLDQPVKDLQGLSVTTYSVTVGNLVEDEELKLMANNIDNHVLKLDKFDGLLGSIKNLTTVACPKSNKPVPIECSVKFEKVGCYKDNQGSPRPLPEYILNDRDSSLPSFSGRYIDWGKSETYMPDFICRCAEKTLSMGNPQRKIFGVQFFGECWTSTDLSPAGYAKDGLGDEDGCKTTYYKNCLPDSDFCVGTAKHNFVYKIDQESIDEKANSV